MLKDFVAFDIEMPTQAIFAISAIGITVVRGGKIVERFYSLVDPETKFNKFVIELIGITPEMVQGQPTLSQLWKTIEHYFASGSVIVAHGAHGDLLTLLLSLRRYGIKLPGEISYLCTCDMTLAESPEFEHHSLDFLCEHFRIDLSHHNAQSDSDGCAEVLLKYIENGVDTEKYIKTVDTEEMLERHKLKRLETRLHQRKINARKDLLKESVFDYEKLFYPQFSANASAERARLIKSRLAAGRSIEVFGVADDALRKILAGMSKDEMQHLLFQKCFESYEMYRLYFFAFNKRSDLARNFINVLSTLPSYSALEGISIRDAARTVGMSGVKRSELEEILVRQNNFGFSVLAVMMMLSDELYESEPLLALELIRRILVYTQNRDTALTTRTVWMLSRLIIDGKHDQEVVSALIPKKFLKRALNIALDDAPEEEDRIYDFYARSLR